MFNTFSISSNIYHISTIKSITLMVNYVSIKSFFNSCTSQGFSPLCFHFALCMKGLFKHGGKYNFSFQAIGL